MASRQTDVRPVGASLHFIESSMRVPLKFGKVTSTGGVCARVRVTVRDAGGQQADGWGETPLAAGWTWPSPAPADQRIGAMQDFCVKLAEAWAGFDVSGHPIEIGCAFMKASLPDLLSTFNASRGDDPMPHLSALVCCSAFDVAVHDAYGVLHGVDVYRTYNAEYMNADLAALVTPAEGAAVDFAGRYPEDFLVIPRPDRLPAWHLVGGKDAVDESELTGDEPDDGLPVVLLDWIRRDGLNCLKVKLRGTDAAWDYARLVKVGKLAIAEDVDWLTADFNCTVSDPAYVNDILDRLVAEQPRIYGMVLYVDGAAVTDVDTDDATYVDMEDLGGPLMIGATDDNAAPASEFTGRIALPFICGKALSAANVAALKGIGDQLLGFA
ncbi:hypothetical protein LCGC14_1963040 [marine sediment metagenome]|uniref:Enolase C-terminal domain-containing protein n=1 Tax=marine sediment metagenome TaxID=412755 RepID=A0A0F9FEB8_9ZZZZ